MNIPSFTNTERKLREKNTKEEEGKGGGDLSEGVIAAED